MKIVRDILKKESFSRDDLIHLLKATGEDRTAILKQAQEIKLREVGNKVYFRGLVEFSNICSKDCLYCGIRKSNRNNFV